MRSESWKFIWQPKVSMRYFLVTDAAFAFAFRFLFTFRRRSGACQEFTGSLENRSTDSRPANHPRYLLHASVHIQFGDGRGCPTPLDHLVNQELSRRASSNLRQV